MNKHDKIFGPLNTKQFIYLFTGTIIIYLALEYTESKFALPISIMAAIIVIHKSLKERTPPFTKEYMDSIRSQKGHDDYIKWLRRKSAEIHSQISSREVKGLRPDPELDRIVNLINEELNN